LDLLSSDPSDINRSNKRVNGFNSTQITYLNFESKLKVTNYSNFIKPKNNQIITANFNKFINEHQQLNYSSKD